MAIGKYKYDLSGKADIELYVTSTHKLTEEELDLIFTDQMSVTLGSYRLTKPDFPDGYKTPQYVHIELEIGDPNNFTVDSYGDTDDVLGSSDFRDVCPTCGHTGVN